MSRRSSNRAPRKSYTTDAFADIPELHDEPQSPLRKADDDDDAPVRPADLSEASGDESLDDDAASQAPSNDTPQKKKRAPEQPVDAKGRSVHQRRVIDLNKYHSSFEKRKRRRLYYGNDTADHITLHKAFAKWGHLPVLPSRAAGFHAPYLNDEQAHAQQIDEDWRWCSGSVRTRQVIEQSSLAEIQHLLPQQERCFLAGPVDEPMMQRLAPLTATTLHAAFATTGKDRNGHVLNAGGRVKCAEWLPFQSGVIQYLAVATVPEPGQHSYRNKTAPAYTRTDPYADMLQIWRIDTGSKEPARLKALITTEYGYYKCIRFCSSPPSSGGAPILLAGVWSDGGLRVLELPSLLENDDFEVYHMSQALVECMPPDTLFTCLTWLSPRRIAAGCASGHVAVLDLNDVDMATNNLRPRQYAPVSATYILTITACTPSCSNMIFTSSMDGFVRLTDTAQNRIASSFGTVHALRTRSLLTNCAWSDYARAALYTDDAFGVRMHLIRRLFTMFSISRTKSTPTALAASPWHPFFLIGTSGGDVQATSSINKIIEIKHRVWQQSWFAHEWRRPNENDSLKDDAISQHIAANGLSRFTEGYKPEITAMMRTNSTSDVGMPGSVTTDTVYEKKSAITTLAWNPNLDTAGWAAAGIADGLVRIEDISLP